MLNVGLTGGIGSGKTTVAQMFESLEIPVYNADLEARKLLNEDEELKREVRKEFGDKVYVNDELDRKAMAGIVFENEEKLNKLNSIVHPAVRRDYRHWAENQQAPYVIREAAILFESGAYKDCDQIITVTANEDVRIKRVMDRDGVGKEEVLKRMDKQSSDKEKIEKSEFVIQNNDGDMILPQVLEIHEKLKELGKNV